MTADQRTPRTPKPERAFRRLLKLFPAEFRGDFGEEMTDVFRHQHRDAERGGLTALLNLWWATLRGIAATAPREHWDLLRSDVRYALRNLRSNPGFTIVATIALAVGIAANAAVFTIVDAVLLRALPYTNPDELVTIFEKVPGAPVDKFDFSAPDFEIVRANTRFHAGMFAYRNGTFELSGVRESERIVSTRVSPEFFTVLGVSPVIGRALTADDDRQGAKVVVLSYGLWTRGFGRDPAAIGRSISLDRQPYTIVGVMGETFEFPPRGAETNGEPAALFLPISFTPYEREAFGSMYNNSVIARLRPGVSLQQARSDLASLIAPLAERYPPELRQLAGQLSLPMWPFLDEVVGRSRRMLLVLMGAVATVLLIGCVDVANLMLTRASSRQREIALRSALGASPARVVRQLVTEGFVLSAFGGVLGLMLTYWSVRVLVTLAGTSLPRSESIAVDGRVLVFTMAVALLTPLIFGVVPALRTAVAATFEALKEGSRGGSGGRARHRLLDSLVVTQFALALVLSVGAGLLLRSFVRLLSTDPGFRAEHVVTASVTLPSGRYTTAAQLKTFFQQLTDAAGSIPGVQAAATSTDRPLNIQERRTFTPDPSAQLLPELSRIIAATWTDGRYFEALGIPLKRGRFLRDSDGRDGGRVVIVSEMLAKRLWPNQDAVGHQIKWGIQESTAPWMTVVGVVGDVNQNALGTETIPQTYEPIVQQSDSANSIAFYRTVHLIARSDRDPAVVLAGVRAVVQRLDPELPLSDPKAVADVVAASVQPQRFSMTVVGVFALVALGLAAIGIYGVLANAVTQQTHEIGVRMALGASAATVIWTVLRRAMLLMAFGVAVGLSAAFALARVMGGLLYEVTPTDGVAFAGAALVLAVLALAASLVPAWRATRVDPLVALRAE